MVKSLLCVIVCFIFAFFSIRSLLYDIVYYLLNNSAVKKRKKGMTFKEWFTFSRFKTEIPSYHIVIYYTVIIIYIIIFIITFIIHVTNIISDFNLLRTIIFLFSVILVGIYEITLEGFHTKYTHIHRRDRIHLKGIDKKAYREKMRKLNEQTKKNIKKRKKQ